MSGFDHKLYFRVALLALIFVLASGICVDLDLGVGNGTIPDNEITASSEQSANTPAKNGRLNYSSGSSWCAGTSDTNPYLQIDLQTLYIICAVSTQGNSQGDHWVKNYKLQLSIDGENWTDYKEGGKVKVLQGNNDGNSSVKHVVYGVLSRYLRFLPQNHQGRVCMRTEVFGAKQKPSTYSIFLACAIALSCIVVVLLIIICGLIWHRRRAVPSESKKPEEEAGVDGFDRSRDKQQRYQLASDPCSYAEPKPTPPNGQCHVPNEYESFEEEAGTAAYYNVTIHEESNEKQNEEVYEEISQFYN